MVQIQIIGQSFIASDTDTGDILIDYPKNFVYYDYAALESGNINIITRNKFSRNSLISTIPLSSAVDSSGTPFTVSSFREFARRNLGFDSGGGDGQGVVTIYDVDFTESSYSFIQPWNGAMVSVNTSQERLEVTSSSLDRGFQILGLEDQVEYLITLDIDLNGMTSVGFYNYWANRIETVDRSGIVAIRFLNEQLNVFPNPIFAHDEAGTLLINSLKIQANSEWVTPAELNQFSDLSGEITLPSDTGNTTWRVTVNDSGALVTTQII